MRNGDGTVGTRNILAIPTPVPCMAGFFDFAVQRIKAEPCTTLLVRAGTSVMFSLVLFIASFAVNAGILQIWLRVWCAQRPLPRGQH